MQISHGRLSIQEVKKPLIHRSKEAHGGATVLYNRRIQIIGGWDIRGQGNLPIPESVYIDTIWENGPVETLDAMLGMIFLSGDQASRGVTPVGL